MFNLRTKQNFMQILRDGRTLKVSIFGLVVGDVVPLKIGDQVAFFVVNLFVGYLKVQPYFSLLTDSFVSTDSC